MTRSEIIDVFIVRAIPSARQDLRQKLDRMTKEELEQAYQVIQTAEALEAKEEELIRIQAEGAADQALHQLRMWQARKPERKAQEEKDRKTFEDAARSLQSFGLNEANLNVIRQTFGPNFTIYNIQQALASNAIILSPPTQEELDEWASETIEAHNLRLLSADLPTLRKLAREAGARGPAAPQPDETQRVRAAGRGDGTIFPALPDEIRIGDREEVLDAAFIRRCSVQTMRFLIKRYGTAQIDEALRTRRSDASPLW